MYYTLRWWIVFAIYAWFWIGLLISSLVIKKKTGDTFSGKTNKENQSQNKLFFISISIGITVVLLHPFIYLIYPNILEITFPIKLIFNSNIEIISGIIAFIGAIFTSIALIQLGSSARFFLAKKETKLITTGVYSISRNPSYIGTYMMLIGIFFLIPSILFITGCIIFLIANHYRILMEESFLKERFKDEYTKYCKKVGRYLIK